jgi:signal transduction histidine kinase
MDVDDVTTVSRAGCSRIGRSTESLYAVRPMFGRPRRRYGCPMTGSIAARRHLVPVPQPFDVAMAAVVAALALGDALVLEPPPEPAAIAVLGALVTTLPIAWRSVAPAGAAVLASLGFLLVVAVGSADQQPTVTWFAPLITVFALGEQGSARALRWAGPVCVLAWSATGVFENDVGATAFGFFGAIGAIAVGRAVRVMGFETEVLEKQVGTLQEERERLAREAVAAERERISRELHDVIGHSISVMGIQAGAVRRVLPADLEREREMLLAVERAGRDSVGEMRRLIDLLRSPGDTPDAAPPTLARIGVLVDDVRRAGLHVELELEGALDDVPPGRALAGYRIVQEALTNALKHAPGARVDVRVARRASEVEIEVRGTPDPQLPPTEESGGQGLIGMRERAALYGGTLEAGPTLDGGFRVLAMLPVEGS